MLTHFLNAFDGYFDLHVGPTYICAYEA